MTEIKEKITDDFLEKMQEEHPMILLTFDKMLKAFFARNPIVYKRFISSVLHLDLLPEEMDLEDKNKELVVSKYTEYSKTVDFNVDINKNILINIELNQAYFKDVKFRNKIYHAKKISLLLNKGAGKEEIKGLENITNIQLNLNAKEKINTLGEDIVVPYSIVTNTVYVNNDKTYIRYLDYYRNLYYNGITNLQEDDYWLALLTARNYVELNDMLSKFVDDKLREDIVKDVIILSSNNEVWDEYERRNADLLVQYTIEKRIKSEEDNIQQEKESIQQEKEKISEEIKNIEHEKESIEHEKESIQQERESIVKSLLESNVGYDVISKVTGKTVEEIKKIENNL